MGGFSAVALAAIVLAGAPVPDRSGATPDFESSFRASLRGDLEIPDAALGAARSLRFVFVGGFRNERMPGYFSQNMGELRALGVPPAQISTIHPSSARTWSENAEGVRASFEAVAARGPEKLVVIGHSRGACDALAFALANPEFVRDRVEAIYLIQGPFGGSGLADFALGGGTPTDRRMRPGQRIAIGLLRGLTRLRAWRSGLEALEGMTREVSRAFWKRTIRANARALAVVGPKAFFIRSRVDPAGQRFFRRTIAWYQRIYLGPGDGMVELDSQALAGVGRILGTVEAGHSDLTQRFPATSASRRFRRALIQGLVLELGARASAAADARPDLAQHAIPKGQAGFQGHGRGEVGVAPAGPVAAADRPEHP